jgi:hypothetical protein
VSLLWVATVFLGSGLLFVIQPMIARMLLPRVGGAPSTWTTCVLFFQGVLLTGYVYAHWVGRRRARTQIAIHGMLLLLPLAVLPFSIVSGASGTGALAPTFWLLRALALAIGLPFFALSAGTPLLQKWLAGTRLPGSDNPYVLYAASNAASLLALAAYPVLIEPALGLARQALFWAVGYAVYVALALMCAVRAWRMSASFKDDGKPAVAEADEPPPARRLHWIALAAAPSSLMLGVTSLLTADAAGLPFLWILPLALYLLTFVLAFARRPGPSRLSDRLPIAAVVFLLLWLIKATEPLAIILGAHLAAFFVAAMVCHTELARLRPPPRHLTAYYAYVGLGGVIGGAFNTLIAPVIFHDWVEIPLAFTLVCLLKPPRDEPDARFRWSDLALAAGLGLLTVALVKAGDVLGATGQMRAALTVGIPVLLMFLLSRRRYRFGLAVGAVLWAGSLDTSLRGKPEMTARSFFGVHRVTRADVTESGATKAFRKLYHGSTIHGVQRVDAATGAPVLPREPLGYYSRNSPIGRLFRSYPADAGPKRVGIVGLGAGSLLAYAEAGERWTLFEIDPLVQRIAEDDRLFSYLPEARKRGVAADVVLGDARLTLAGDDGPFDVLVLDAFTSAAVPVHLLTREALALYDRKLAPSGIVACHISNRHLDLGSLVRATAEDLGLASTLDAGPPSSGAPAMVMPSRWAFLARSPDALRARDLPSIVTFALRKRGRTWTDDRSDLWSVFQW